MRACSFEMVNNGAEFFPSFGFPNGCTRIWLLVFKVSDVSPLTRERDGETQPKASCWRNPVCVAHAGWGLQPGVNRSGKGVHYHKCWDHSPLQKAPEPCNQIRKQISPLNAWRGKKRVGIWNKLDKCWLVIVEAEVGCLGTVVLCLCLSFHGIDFKRRTGGPDLPEDLDQPFVTLQSGSEFYWLFPRMRRHVNPSVCSPSTPSSPPWLTPLGQVVVYPSRVSWPGELTFLGPYSVTNAGPESSDGSNHRCWSCLWHAQSPNHDPLSPREFQQQKDKESFHKK